MQTMEVNPTFTLRLEHPKGLHHRGGDLLPQTQGCPEGLPSSLQNLRVPEGLIFTPSRSLEIAC